ncbi:MAG: FHA domain-containing protein, partial [Actinomycetota bacterium]|nr:FHA domain-containing protein [Actinomycetota bacterium]
MSVARPTLIAMRTRLTLQVGDDRRDVEIRAPVGTTLAELRAGLSAAAPAASGRSGDAVWWAGSRALPAGAALGGPGLRNGSVVGLDRPGPRDTAAQAVLRLHVVGGPDAGMIVAVPRGQLSIGRAPECDVRLSDQDVSRRHATLTMTSAGLTLHDLGSTNGSYVGDPHG